MKLNFLVSVQRTNGHGLGLIQQVNLTMPYIRGFGNITDLQTAMAGNSELEALVRQDIVSQNDIDILTDQIIYAWAGVSNTVSGSGGTYIDARQLAVMEVATGEYYRNTVNGTANLLI